MVSVNTENPSLNTWPPWQNQVTSTDFSDFRSSQLPQMALASLLFYLFHLIHFILFFVGQIRRHLALAIWAMLNKINITTLQVWLKKNQLAAKCKEIRPFTLRLLLYICLSCTASFVQPSLVASSLTDWLQDFNSVLQRLHQLFSCLYRSASTRLHPFETPPFTLRHTHSLYSFHQNWDIWWKSILLYRANSMVFTALWTPTLKIFSCS